MILADVQLQQTKSFDEEGRGHTGSRKSQERPLPVELEVYEQCQATESQCHHVDNRCPFFLSTLARASR